MTGARHALGLGLAVLTAFVTAACGGNDPSALGGSRRGAANGSAPNDPGGAPNGGSVGTPGNAETISPDGKLYLTQNVQPALAQTCGGCPAPAWIVKQDASRSYAMMFQLGYVSKTSRIVLKGPHAGGAAPVLTADQSQKFQTWVGMEGNQSVADEDAALRGLRGGVSGMSCDFYGGHGFAGFAARDGKDASLVGA